jgi:tetratricopeptide (TPR) repeat protein
MPDAEERQVTVEEFEQQLCERVAACERNLKAAIWELVVFYSRTDRHAEALEHLDHLLGNAADPGERAFLLLSLGQLMEQLGEFAAAADAYRRALGLEPAEQRVWYFVHNNLGYCLNTLGRFADAEPYCRKALEIDPGCYNAHKNLGLALEGQGRYVEAAHVFAAAMEKCPQDPRAAQHLWDMLAAHPEVAGEIPDIASRLTGGA